MGEKKKRTKIRAGRKTEMGEKGVGTLSQDISLHVKACPWKEDLLFKLLWQESL